MNFPSLRRSGKSAPSKKAAAEAGRKAIWRAVRQTFEALEVRQFLTAVVTTDKADYAPGSTAYFTASSDSTPGTNFQVGETVQFRALRINPNDGTEETLPGSQPWRVADGVWSLDGGKTIFAPYVEDGVGYAPDLDKTVNGSFDTTWYVDPVYLDATLELTASGLTSGAVATHVFTDGSVQAGMALDGVTSTTTDSYNLQTTNYNLVNGQLVADTKPPANQSTTVTVGSTTNVPSAGDTYERLTASQFGIKKDAAGNPLTMFSYWSSSENANFKSFSNTILVTDFGNGSRTYTAHYVPYRSAPSVTATSTAQNGVEGTPKTFNLGTFSDSTGGPWTVTVDWNDGTTPTTFNMPGTSASNVAITPQSHAYANNETGPEPYQVTVTVTDSTGLSATDSLLIHVANAAPAVTAPANQSALAATSTPFTLGSFSDPGTLDSPWSVNVNWGDNTTATTFTTNTQGSLGSQSHSYAKAGTYTTTVQVTDKDGGASSATFQVTVGANATITTAASATGTYGGTTTLSATLKKGTTALAGQLLTFKIDANTIGTATTDANGVATLSNVSLVSPNVYGAGNHTITASFAGDSTNAASSGTNTLAIAKAPTTTVVTINGGPFTYTGSAQTPATVSVTGAGGLNLTPTATYTGNVNAGTATASYSYAGDANHEASSDSKAFAIAKATPAVSVTPSGGTYDGSAFAATGSVTGVSSADLGTPTFTYYAGTTATGTALSGAPVNAGTYTVVASYAGSGNYASASTSATFTVARRAVSITADAKGKTYGQADPALTYQVTSGSLVNGDAFGGALARDGGENAGQYNITQGTLALSSNYTLAFVGAKLTIAKANATVVVTPYDVTYDGQAHTATYTISGVNGESGATVGSVTLDTTTHTNAGTYGDSWSFTGAANYNDIAATTITDTIKKAPSTTTVTGGTFTYDGTAKAGSNATVTGDGTVTGSPSLAYYVGTDTSGTGSATAPTAGGTYTVKATYAGDANHEGSSGTATITINKAAPTVSVTAPDATYSGGAYTGASGSVTGVTVDGTAENLGAPTFTYYAGTTVSGATKLSAVPVNAGTYTVVASYAGSDNYAAASGSTTFKIAKATLTVGTDPTKANTIVVAGYSVTYDGNGHTATGSVTGANGESLSGLTLSGTTHTNAGTYAADAWTFTDTTGNYNDASGTISDSIAKAASTTVVTINGGPFTYTGSAQTPATVSVTGAGGLSLSGTATYAGNVNAGTATASYTYAGDANHTGSSDSKTFAIAKVNPALTVTAVNSVYDGLPHSATDAIAGVTGPEGQSLEGVTPELIYRRVNADNTRTLLSTAPTNAGQYEVAATFAGSADYNAFSTLPKLFTIDKAASTTAITINGGPFTYTGSAQTPATVSVTGAGGLSLSGTATYADNVNAGTATASYSYAGDANHYGSSDSKTFTIGKATSTTTTSGVDPFTYDGTTHAGGSGTVTGAGGLSTGATSLTYSGDQVNAGTYTVTAHYAGDANHLASDGAPVTIAINKANQTITWNDPADITYGTALSGTQLNANVAGVTNGSAAGLLTYSLAPGTVLSAGDGQALTVNAAETANYNAATKTVHINVAKAPLTVSAASQTKVYGTPNPELTGTFSGVVNNDGITVGYSTSATQFSDVTADGYAIIATLQDPNGKLSNYAVTNTSGTLTITRAPSTTTVTVPTGAVYDGQGHPATASTTGVGGLSVSTAVTYQKWDSASRAWVAFSGTPTDAGTYRASASYAESTNHLTSSDAKEFTIAKATATVNVTGYTGGTYDGTAHTQTVTVTGVGALYTTSLTGTDATSYSTPWSFSNDNYNSVGGTLAFAIAKAGSSVIATGDSFVYDGATHTGGSAVVSGAGTVTGSAVLSYSGDQVNAGSYTVTATYAGDANHTGSSDSATITITKAPSSVAVTGGTFTYDGNAHGGTNAVVSGAGTVTGGATLTYYAGTTLDPAHQLSGAPVNAGTYTVLATYAGDDNHTASSKSATITIDKAASSVAVTGAGFTYDGTAHAGGSATVSGAGTVTGNAVLSYTGDRVNAGSYTVTATYAGDANHTGSSGSATITVSAGTAGLSLSTSATRVYDGAGQSVTFIITGVNGADLSAYGTLSFYNAGNGQLDGAPRNVGANYKVIGNFAGLDLNKDGQLEYFAGSTSQLFDITPRHITGDFTAAAKTYDGNTSATVTGRTLIGTVGGDGIGLAGGAATFDSRNAGAGKLVTLTGAALDGASAGNYVLDSVHTATADITAKAITGSVTAANKVYDSTTGATITSRTLGGVIAGDTVSYEGGSAAFSDKNVGTAKTVTATDLSLSGADAANYTVNTAATTAASISPFALTGSITAANKVYDSTVSATINGRTLSGVFSRDSVSYVGGAATFDTASAGTYKLVTATGLGLSGDDAGNYTVNTTATTHADVTKAPSTTSVTGGTFTYDGSAHGQQGSAVTGVNLGTIATSFAYYDAANTLLAGAPTDAGTYTVVGYYAGDANHDASTSASATIKINKAASTTVVTIAPGTFTYTGSALTPATVAVTGAGGLSLSATATYADNVNAGTATATYTYGGDANHEASSDTKTFTIAKAASTTSVTVSNATYDGTAHGGAAQVTGVGGLSQGLTVTYTGINGTAYNSTAAPTNAGSYTASATFAGDANHLGSSDSKTFTIAKATLALGTNIIITDYAGTYDGLPHGLVGSAYGLNNENLNSLLSLGAGQTTVGTYPTPWSFAGNSNYNAASGTATIQINKATPKVTASRASGTYDGTAFVATGTVAGVSGTGTATLEDVGLTFKYFAGSTASGTPLAGAPTDAGTYTVVACFAGSTDYAAVTSAPVTFTIARRAITVTAAAKSKVYGDADPALTYAITSGTLVAGDAVTGALTRAAGENAGIYAIGQGTVTAGGNYNLTYGGASLTVNKATLTVTADNQSRTYGDANPTFTASFSGFKNGETLATSGVTGTTGLTTAATAASNVSSYAIMATSGSLAADNYSFIFVNGTLSVTKATLTVTADSKSRTYGDANPALTYSVTGFKNGQTALGTSSGTSGAPTLSTTATAASNAGAYDILAAAGTLNGGTNYTFSFVQGALTINKATLTVTPYAATRVYGAPDPTFTPGYQGFKNGQALATSGVTGSPSLSSNANFASPVGTYAITPTLGTLAAANYAFTFVPGTLTVTRAGTTVAIGNVSPTVYGGADPNQPWVITLTASVGAISPSTATVNEGTVTFTLKRPNGTVAQTVTGSVSGGTASAQVNLGGSYTAGNYTIEATYVPAGTAPNFLGSSATGAAAKTLAIGQRDGRTAYIGANVFVTSSASTSTTTAVLTASVTDPFGNSPNYSVASSTVTFYDIITGAVLASNVPVKLVSNSDWSVGTATATVTLSAGNYGMNSYLIGISLDGSYRGNNNPQIAEGTDPSNPQQVGTGASAESKATATVTVMTPSAGSTIRGSGTLVNTNTSSGAYVGDAGANTEYNFGINYGKGGTNPQGNAILYVHRDGHTYVIKTNSITSLVFGTTTVDGTTLQTATFYAKASMYEVDSTGRSLVSVDGNITLRMDIVDGGTTGKDQIGFTVLSKTSALYYSNNWVYNATYGGWRTDAQAVTAADWVLGKNDVSVQIF